MPSGLKEQQRKCVWTEVRDTEMGVTRYQDKRPRGCCLTDIDLLNWRRWGDFLRSEQTNGVIQGGGKVGLRETWSLFLFYYILITVLFYVWTTVNLLLPHPVLLTFWQDNADGWVEDTLRIKTGKSLQSQMHQKQCKRERMWNKCKMHFESKYNL